MAAFIRANNLKEALERASQAATIVAGATDLFVRIREMRLRGVTPSEPMVDITGIPELQKVDMKSRRPFLGSAVTIKSLETDPDIDSRVPMLQRAAALFGSPQVRTMATIGGNVANASPAADGLSALTALAAVAEIASIKGKREARLEDLVIGPNRTSLEMGEIITGFYLDNLPKNGQSSFYKVGRRKALVIARVNLALCMDREMADPRVVVGACFPSPRRLNNVEELLRSGEPGPDLWRRAGAMAAGEFCSVCGWRSSTPYKVPALTNMVAGAMGALWNALGENR